MLVQFLLFLILCSFFLKTYKRAGRPSRIEVRTLPTGRELLRVTYRGPAPSVWQLYANVVFNQYNFTKPSQLGDKKPPLVEVFAIKDSATTEQLQKYIKVCGYQRQDEVPPIFHFASSLPMMTHIISHKAFPLKPMATLVHIKQSVRILRPFKTTDTVSKRAVFTKFEQTERGTLLEAALEVYSPEGQMGPKNLVGVGVTSLLVLAPRKKGAKKPEKEKEDSKEKPQLLRSHHENFPGNQGRIYAPTTGDYNPWHLWGFSAKLFGFKKPIVQGMFAFAKAVSLLGDKSPDYPLVLEASFKKPCFLPSKVEFKELRQEEGVGIELWSKDGEHLHMIGSVRCEPDMVLEPANVKYD